METPQTRPPLTLCLVVGVVAGATGIAAAQLIASITRNFRSPVLDVGDRVVDGVPSWAKDLAISWFGTNDKIALLVGIGSMLGVFAAVLGVLALRKNLNLAYAGAALFGVIGAAATLGRRTGANVSVVIPSIVGAGVVALVLWWARRQVVGNEQVTTSLEEHPSHRRRFLASLGLISTVAVVGGLTGQRLERRFSAEGSRDSVALTQGTTGPPAIPTGA